MTSVALPEHLTVLPWIEADLNDDSDQRCYDPRSAYVEKYWLGILGPSGTWIIRRLADRFDHDPDGFLLDTAEFAAEIGLGRGIGANAPFTRTINRLGIFDLARRAGDQLHARLEVPALNRRQASKLAEHVAREHAGTETADLDRVRSEETRGRVLAAQLAELGDTPARVITQLQVLGLSAAVSELATSWAFARRAHPSYQPADGVLLDREIVSEAYDAA